MGVKSTIDKRQFKDLTRAEQRVAIARDVIAQLNARAILATPGIYFEFPKDALGEREHGDWGIGDKEPTLAGKALCDVLTNAAEPCQVCALGAVFVSAACAAGDYAIKGVELSTGDIFAERPTQGAMHRYLGGFFDEEQLELMENAFEATNINGSYDDDDFITTYGVAADMFENVEDPTERLRLVMQNVVDNGGTFVVG